MQNVEKIAHSDIIVNKPWGYEYLAYENKNLAIWILHIKENEKTSLHCHSKKLTGLICLDGLIEVNFLNDKVNVCPMQKVMIRPTLFHSSKSLKGESVIIEIETPVDKNDLIRLTDSYGREKKRYEKSEMFRKRTSKEIYLEKEKQNKFLNYTFNFIKVKNKNDLMKYKDCIFIILNGNFINKNENRNLNVISSGDCVYFNVYEKILPAIDLVEDCEVIVLSRKKL